MANPILSISPVVELDEVFYGSVFGLGSYTGGADMFTSDIPTPADGILVVQVSTQTAGILTMTQIDRANGHDWNSELNGGTAIPADAVSEFEIFVREGDLVNFTLSASVVDQLVARVFFRQRGG